MKKVYSLLMAAAVTLSAAAINPANFGKSMRLGTKIESNRTATPTMKRMAKSPALAADLSDYAGTWNWMTYDMYEDKVITLPLTATVTDDDTILIENFIQEGFSIEAIVDPTTGNIVIPCSLLAEDGDALIVFAKFGYELDDEGYLESLYPTDDDLVLTYDEEEGAYCNWDCICGVAFIVDGEFYWGDEDSELWDIFPVLWNQVMVTITPGDDEDVVDDPANYEDAGYAEFTDGWLLPGIPLDPAEFPYIVPLQKSLVEEGVYRLVDPYSALGDHPYGFVNSSTDPGYIKFNIADPAIPYVYAGVYSGLELNGFGRFYMTDLVGYYVCEQNYAPNIHYFEVMFNKNKLSTFDVDTATLDIPSCMFSLSGAKHNYTGWADEDNNAVDMHSTIHILGSESGIGNIVATEAAPLEFYNLQGQKVANPRGICIMRNGDTYKKVVR